VKNYAFFNTPKKWQELMNSKIAERQGASA
jgi:hypothetical protein